MSGEIETNIVPRSFRIKHRGRSDAAPIPLLERTVKLFRTTIPPFRTRWRDVCLHHRQGDADDLLVFIKGVDIGHAADIVDNGHDAGLERGGGDVVLAADTADELA